MHQAHTIPWNTLASHFVFVRDNPRRTPRTTDIFPIDPPRRTCAGDLNHFTRVLAETIRSFSRTEREKHPSAEELGSQVTSPTCDHSIHSDGTNADIESMEVNPQETDSDPSSSSTSLAILRPKLFPDALLTRYPQYLTQEMQNPLYWAKRACRPNLNGYLGYSTLDGDLADAIKVLMYATDSRGVLCLAHLPSPSETRTQNLTPLIQVDPHPSESKPVLATLSNLSWGHSFGFNRIVDSALLAYIYLNLSAALDLISSGAFMETPAFERMFQETTQEMDYCAQQLPHRDFWTRVGFSSAANQEEPGLRWRFHTQVPKTRPWTGSDLEWLQRYLKELFRLMYVCDMVTRECGMEVQWEREIVHTVSMMIRAKIKMTEEGVEFA